MPKKIYGILGHPVRHSFSPAMQGAAFGACGIDAEYRLFDVEPGALEDFLENLPSSGISGLNVTIPHKIAARAFLERNGSLDDNAERLGAVNTIKLAEGEARGYNTDGPGFYRSLVEDLRFEPEGRSIFVLGAGGAATAVVMYLGNGPRRITVYDPDRCRLSGLIEHHKRYFDPKRLSAVGREGIGEAVEKADLIVNATPVGMRDGDPSPIDKKYLRAGLFVYDLVYNRPSTRLVKDANGAKCHAVNGLGMLLYQGAVSFEIWTGLKAPVDKMRRALQEAIKANG